MPIPQFRSNRFKACVEGAIIFLILCAAASVHGQSCPGMSLGTGASLNGFVPFPLTNAWNTNIASAPVDPNSAAIVAAPGFTGLSTHINFGSSPDDGGIPYVVVDSSTTPAVPINVIDYANESDVVVAPYPGAAPIEGGFADCTGWPDTYQSDAHILVLDRAKCELYETFNTNRCNGLYDSSSETIWDMKISESRPWGWTSADAAGLPIFPGLVRYDEVASGAIHHAIRFTMQHTKNDANDGYFVEPATHAAGTDFGVSNIMGMRIRLKATFNISGYSPTNQVILTALKQYGMILADNGGSFFIQGSTDPRWDDADLANLGGINSSNFDVVQMTPAFPGYDSATAPTGSLPVIESFSATASSVNSGSPVTFNYSASGDSYDFIDMIGPIAAGTGSVVINPTATQTYTMYSTNAFGQTVSSPITVAVPGSVVTAPTFAPPGGSYTGAQTITISTSTYPYATIYYTTDGSTPTYPITGATKAYPVTPAPPNSQGAVNSITLSVSETVKAIAIAPGYSAPSAVGSATYVIGNPAAAAPTFAPAGGIYNSVQQVTISTTTTSGTPQIYYTTDGSTPTSPITGTTKLYASAVTVSNSETLNAITAATGFSNSAVGSASYTINLPQAATPTFNPPAGAYGPAQMVTIITATTTGSPVIYYTTDGSNPATSGTAIKYTGAISVSESEIVNAVAEATGLVNSSVGSAAYTINGLPFAATPTFNAPPGTYTSVQTVAIGSTTPNAKIYYTTDGSNPATSPTTKLYSAAISVSASESVKAVAEATGFNNSVIGSAAYIINLPFPGPRYVQECSQGSSFSMSASCTLNGVAAGDTLVIGVVGSGVVQSAAVTSSSGTPVLAVKDGDTLSAYILPNTGAGNITITVSVSANTTYWMSVFEYSNVAISPLDGIAFGASTIWQPTSFSSPTFATTATSDTLWAECLAPSGYTFTSGTAPILWTTVPTPAIGYGTLVEDGPATSAGSYYGQCGTGGGAAIPEIVTLALKPAPVVTTPALTSPAPGSKLGASQNFTWSTGSGVTQYALWLGTTEGSSNLYNSGHITGTTTSVTGLPMDGSTIYAQLFYYIGGVWKYLIYTYTAAGPPVLTSPAPGSVLGTNPIFTWSAQDTGVTQFDFWLGTSQGSSNLYNSGHTTATSAAVTGLPTNNSTIYGQLDYYIGGVWKYAVYTFISPGPPAIISPAPGSVLGSSASFVWSPGIGATMSDLTLGTNGVGSSNLYSSGQVAGNSATVTGLPGTGATVYAQLGSLIGGSWQYVNYTYTETAPPAKSILLSPAPGSVLGASPTFTWSAGSQVTQYDLWVGTIGPGSSNLYNSGHTTAKTSGAVSVPQNGETVYVELFSFLNGVWQYTNYTYTAQ